jgi:carbon-monoxide dehydrogenase large subunit
MTVVDEPTTVQAPEKEVGKARRRKEDARLITGRTTWTDNMVLPGMLHIAVVRSPVAHARITGVDVSAAQQAPGVVAVFTGRDFADEQGSIPCAWPVTPDMVNPGHPSIAVDSVNHVGEAVALIVARSKVAAQDAVELVDVDYDVLPPVLHMEEAIKDGADLVHDHLDSNTSFHFVFDGGEAGAAGDTEQAFADADVVVSRRFVQQRLIPAFMEPRSVVV